MPAEDGLRPGWARLYARPLLLVLAGLAFTLWCLGPASGIRVGNDLESLLAGSADYPVYQEFIERFGSDETVAVYWEAGELSGSTLLRLYDTEAALRAVPVVRRTTSLLCLVPVEHLASREALEAWLARPLSLGRLKETACRTRLLRRRLASRDLGWLAVAVQLDLPSGGREAQARRRHAVDALREACASLSSSSSPLDLLGYPVVEARVIDLVAASNRTLIPVSVAVGSVVLLAVFRSFRFLVAAQVAILSALVWTLAAFRLTDYTLNIFSTMLFPLVLSVGLTTTDYLLTAFRAHVRTPAGVLDPAPELTVLPAVVPPCFLCALTTFIGFSSLAANQSPESRNFGLYSGLGTLLCLGAALLFIPAILKLWGTDEGPGAKGREDAGGTGKRGTRFGLRIAALTGYVLAHRGSVAAASAAFVLVAGLGVARLPIESSSLRGLRDDDPVIVARDRYERAFEPANVLEVVLGDGQGGDLTDLGGFRRMRALQADLERLPGVRGTLSFADLVLDASSYLSRSEKVDVATERELTLLQRFYAAGEWAPLWSGFVADGGCRLRLRLAVEPDGSLALLRLSEQVLDRVRRAQPAGSVVTLTGRNYLSALTHRSTLENEGWSFLGSLGAIMVVLMVAYRSVRLGALSVVPNVLPLVMTYGTMGWLQVPFDISTGMILCVTIGMVVDDTIHYLHVARGLRRQGVPHGAALKRASRELGGAMVSTALILSSGILVLTFSQFRMIATFGLFTAVAVLYSVVVELLLTPCLLGLLPGLLAAGPTVKPGPTQPPPAPGACAVAG